MLLFLNQSAPTQAQFIITLTPSGGSPVSATLTITATAGAGITVSLTEV